jgi:fatty-acyl-CoA synthase
MVQDPQVLEVRGRLPMTVTGKIQKYKMRETSVTELGLDAAAAVKTA